MKNNFIACIQLGSCFHIKEIKCMQFASRDSKGSAGSGFKVNDKIAAHFPFLATHPCGKMHSTLNGECLFLHTLKAQYKA
jgi:hypothetical protein